MGRGLVVSGGAKGLYRVQLRFNRTRAEAEKLRLGGEIESAATLLARLLTDESEMQVIIDQLNRTLSAQIASGDKKAIASALLDRDAAWTQLQVVRLTLDGARLRKLSLEKRQAWLDSTVSPDPEIDAYCADFTEALTGDVGTIEIAGDRELGVLIRPGYAASGPSPAVYDARRDGMIAPAAACTAAQAYWNLAMRHGWRRWMPQYRAAVITALDRRNNICDVTLDYMSHRGAETYGISENPPDGLRISGVPINYMNCHALAFATGDRVVVEFSGQSLDSPMVIGFASGPMPCRTMLLTLVSAAAPGAPSNKNVYQYELTGRAMDAAFIASTQIFAGTDYAVIASPAGPDWRLEPVDYSYRPRGRASRTDYVFAARYDSPRNYTLDSGGLLNALDFRLADAAFALAGSPWTHRLDLYVRYRTDASVEQWYDGPVFAAADRQPQSVADIDPDAYTHWPVPQHDTWPGYDHEASKYFPICERYLHPSYSFSGDSSSYGPWSWYPTTVCMPFGALSASLAAYQRWERGSFTFREFQLWSGVSDVELWGDDTSNRCIAGGCFTGGMDYANTCALVAGGHTLRDGRLDWSRTGEVTEWISGRFSNVDGGPWGPVYNPINLWLDSGVSADYAPYEYHGTTYKHTYRFNSAGHAQVPYRARMTEAMSGLAGLEILAFDHDAGDDRFVVAWAEDELELDSRAEIETAYRGLAGSYTRAWVHTGTSRHARVYYMAVKSERGVTITRLASGAAVMAFRKCLSQDAWNAPDDFAAYYPDSFDISVPVGSESVAAVSCAITGDLLIYTYIVYALTSAEPGGAADEYLHPPEPLQARVQWRGTPSYWGNPWTWRECGCTRVFARRVTGAVNLLTGESRQWTRAELEALRGVSFDDTEWQNFMAAGAVNA